jgi:hypothetical protein
MLYKKSISIKTLIYTNIRLRKQFIFGFLSFKGLEMCHLVIANHNKKFYSTLTAVMPKWKKCKDKLERKLS